MKKFRLVIGLLTLAIFLTVRAHAEELCSTQVVTSEGPVTGIKSKGFAACEYKGIPYATQARWKAPAPAAKHNGVFAAVKFGPACMQNQSFGAGGKAPALSEDCLTLNIFRPAKSGIFPVMFWIHGGGYTQGAGSYDIYEGSHLAATRDVVVVTINYRLGPFGFLSLAPAADEDPNHSTGNYGLMDQVAALRWVHDNIKNFGGDPERVTIFGESAGGVSVCNLLVAKPAVGLYSRAIMESGACDLVRSQAKGFEQSSEVAKQLGCTDSNPLPCLRAKPAEAFLKIKPAISASAHIDGYLLKAKPSELLKKGDFNHVPFLVGSNKNEFNIRLATMPGAMCMTRTQVNKTIRAMMGERADDILKLYSFDDYRHPWQLAAAAYTDGFGSRAFDAAESASAFTPVFLYRFDWQSEALGKNLGSFHGLELPFVFGTLDAPGPLHLVLTKRAVKSGAQVSEAMMDYWTNFAKSGNPNGSGLANWPLYDAKTRERNYLKNPVGAAALTAREIARYQYFAGLSIEDLHRGKMKK
jgi:para-nitrobenzyl esterase